MSEVTRIDDCIGEGYIEVFDNDDYEPGIQINGEGEWVNLNSDGVDELIAALARSQGYDSDTLRNLALDRRTP